MTDEEIAYEAGRQAGVIFGVFFGIAIFLVISIFILRAACNAVVKDKPSFGNTILTLIIAGIASGFVQFLLMPLPIHPILAFILPHTATAVIYGLLLSVPGDDPIGIGNGFMVLIAQVLISIVIGIGLAIVIIPIIMVLG